MVNQLYIDTHAHLDDARFADDLDAVIDRAQEAGVGKIVTIGTDVDSSRRCTELCERYDCVYGSAGLHPHEATSFSGELVERLIAMLEYERVVGLGEVGLDFHYCRSPVEVQKEVFGIFVDLASELDKPLIVHSREAEKETLQILDAHGSAEQRVIIHCFSGSRSFAQECVARGFVLGLGGIVTFPNAQEVQSAVQHVPAQNMILETDCPYLAPQVKRGSRNEPAYVPIIAREVAELKGMRVEELERVTTGTAEGIYGI